MATVRIYNLTSENTSPQAGQYLAIDGSSTTQKINYSNLKKGIIGDTSMNTTATTVTGAIAEHSSTLATHGTDIDDLQEDMSDVIAMQTAMFLKRDYTCTYSSGGSTVNLSAQDFNVTTPSGYTPIALTKIATGNANIVVRSYNAAATGASYIVNFWSDNIAANNLTASITVLYVRTGLIGS